MDRVIVILMINYYFFTTFNILQSFVYRVFARLSDKRLVFLKVITVLDIRSKIC